MFTSNDFVLSFSILPWKCISLITLNLLFVLFIWNISSNINNKKMRPQHIKNTKYLLRNVNINKGIFNTRHIEWIVCEIEIFVLSITIYLDVLYVIYFLLSLKKHQQKKCCMIKKNYFQFKREKKRLLFYVLWAAWKALDYGVSSESISLNT